ncbi:MAG: hypothetical protein WCR40_02060 [Candidatus Paceibacterota bacterium]
MFVAAQKSFEQGLSGAFWFIFPNFLALLVFAPFALKVRKILPKGYTFPQFIKMRHGKGVHVLYMIQFLILQICSFAVQILAGATLIKTLSGLPFLAVAIVLVLIVLIYAIIGGLRASVATDYVQMGLIFIVLLVTIPWVITKAGGFEIISAGLAGFSGKFGNIFDPWVFYSFGIPTVIGLLSGPIGDQMHWQRAYSLKSDKDVIKTFSLAAFLFALVPLSLSLLGFVAAGKTVTAGWVISSAQMVGPLTVSMLLPNFMLVAFVMMLLAGLCSTLDSILCAVSSLTVVDIFKPSRELVETGNDTNPNKMRIARISMIAMALLGLGVALIPNLKILHLFLFYATLRAATLVPTILTVFWSKLKSRAVFWGVLLSMIFGAPLMAVGSFIGNPHISVAGSILTVLIGLIVCLLISKRSSEHDSIATSELNLESLK